MTKGSEGLHSVNSLKIPKMPKKHIGLCPQALISHIKPIMKQKKQKAPYEMQNKNEKDAELHCPIFPFMNRVFGLIKRL